MLTITNLCKTYGSHTLFHDVNFVINDRERVGLVGRNGHGKTTLFRLLAGQEHPDTGSITAPKGYRVGYLEQNLHFTQKSLVAEGCLGLPVHLRDETWQVEKVLSGLGFSQADFSADPHTFSGGFQIRLQLAKTLVSDAELLLLDEPTNYLDIVTIRWLASFLQTWQHELILITHDRSFMNSVVTHTLGIHRQQVRKIAGNTDKYYGQIVQEEEVHERTRVKDEKKRKKTEVFINKFRAKARQAGLAQSRVKMLEKQDILDKLQEIETIKFSFPSHEFPAKTMLHAHNLTFSYSGNKPYLFDKLSFAVRSHDRICIIGKNGKGKSTLLKVINEELTPLAGNCKRHPLLEVGYFAQTNVAKLHPEKSIYHEILEASPDCTPQKAHSIAGAMLFSDDQSMKLIKVLSGGEKSRVLLGKLLAVPSNLLLLDEPTSHLDMESCSALTDALKRFHGGVVLVTHDEEMIRALATTLIVFKHDRVFVFEGTYDEFLEDIGWDSDAMPEDVARKKKAIKISTKEFQKKKIEYISPLKKRISEIEKTIEALEQESVEIVQQITTPTEQSKVDYAEFGRRNHDILESLEHYYKELERANEEYEKALEMYEE